jgi:2-iminobutanoate/2-iminopropanoate deaminase
MRGMISQLDPPTLPPGTSTYTHGTLVTGTSRTVFVSGTCYLSDRRYRQEFIDVRAEFLGDHRPALTIIITDIYSEDWLLEIEAIAMA